MDQERYSVAQLKALGGFNKLLKAVQGSKSKYKNKVCVWKGQWRGREQELRFDSLAGMNRFLELKIDPTVCWLGLQEKFLISSKSDTEKPSYYVADFVYKKAGRWHIEDKKGKKTDTYILKRKLVKEKYPSMIFIES